MTRKQKEKRIIFFLSLSLHTTVWMHRAGLFASLKKKPPHSNAICKGAPSQFTMAVCVPVKPAGRADTITDRPLKRLTSRTWLQQARRSNTPENFPPTKEPPQGHTMTSTHIPNAKYNKVKCNRKDEDPRLWQCHCWGSREKGETDKDWEEEYEEGGGWRLGTPPTGNHFFLPYCSHWMFTRLFLMV